MASNDNYELIAKFLINRPEGKGLERYIKKHALDEEQSNLARTYLVKDSDTDEIAGFFSLKAGMIGANEVRRLGHTEFDSIPGIEISNFAINDMYKNNHKGQSKTHMLGYTFFIDLILPIIEDISEKIGVSVLYIFALPEQKLIEHYQKYGFQRLPKKIERRIHRRIRPRYDNGCIFMWQLL